MVQFPFPLNEALLMNWAFKFLIWKFLQIIVYLIDFLSWKFLINVSIDFWDIIKNVQQPPFLLCTSLFNIAFSIKFDCNIFSKKSFDHPSYFVNDFQMSKFQVFSFINKTFTDMREFWHFRHFLGYFRTLILMLNSERSTNCNYILQIYYEMAMFN